MPCPVCGFLDAKKACPRCGTDLQALGASAPELRIRSHDKSPRTPRAE